MLREHIEESENTGDNQFSTGYQWIKFDSDYESQSIEASKRRLATHPVTTWRSMESRLYALSRVHNKSEEYISNYLDLCPTDFYELRKVNGRGRLPGENTITRNWNAAPYIPCTES